MSEGNVRLLFIAIVFDHTKTLERFPAHLIYSWPSAFDPNPNSRCSKISYFRVPIFRSDQVVALYRYGHIPRSAKSRIFGFWRVEKSQKYCDFPILVFFSWEALGSRYFVCRIVFGCVGVRDSRTSSILVKSIKILGLEQHFTPAASGPCPSNIHFKSQVALERRKIPR